MLLSPWPISYGATVGPVVGEKLTLTVSDIACGGEGVARHNDFVYFVPWVAVGEVVEAEIIPNHVGRDPLQITSFAAMVDSSATEFPRIPQRFQQ